LSRHWSLHWNASLSSWQRQLGKGRLLCAPFCTTAQTSLESVHSSGLGHRPSLPTESGRVSANHQVSLRDAPQKTAWYWGSEQRDLSLQLVVSFSGTSSRSKATRDRVATGGLSKEPPDCPRCEGNELARAAAAASLYQNSNFPATEKGA
jgi:hypothetical protein